MEESLEQERVGREMELAHNLQMKLLPAMDAHDPVCMRRGSSRPSRWAATSTSSSAWPGEASAS
jgi:hypothetical protein